MPWVVAWLGEAYLLAGRLVEANPCAERALALARTHKERGNEAWALRLLGAVQAQGDTPAMAQAATSYHQTLALAEELGMRPLQAHCHRGLGTLYAQTGRRSRPALSCLRPSTRTGDGDDLLVATDGGGAGAGERTITGESIIWHLHETLRRTPLSRRPPRLSLSCTSFRTPSATYAMMESRTSREAKHLAERRRGGLFAVVDQVIALLRQRGRPGMSIAVIAGNLAFSPALDVSLTSVLSTQFFTL